MQTPTKKVKRGRKPASDCPSDFCRLCKPSFKVRSSDIKKIYHRKLYLRHRRLQNDTSDRVCKACAREVRNAPELFGCIKTALENEEACREKDENYTDCKDNNASQIKRQ